MAKYQKIVRSVCIETAGSFLIAVGIYNFAVQSAFPMTGFSGISIILYRLAGLPIGLTTVLLNIPVAALCYRLLGRGFLLRSVRCILISSFLLDQVAPLLPVYQGDRWLSALCTGVIAGAGYAFIYMENSSTGGSDFIVMAVKAHRPHWSLGQIAFWSDVGIILVGGVLFRDIDGIIYGLVVNYLFALVVNRVMYGRNSGKFALIVTNHGAEITQVIGNCTGRGSTIVDAAGGYRLEHRQMVMCACSNKQMYSLQKAVKQADPGAFMVVIESNEVHGEGFRVIQPGSAGG